MFRSPLVRVAFMWSLLMALFLGKTQFATLVFGTDYSIPRHIVMALLSSALVVPAIILARRHLDREPISELDLALDWSALRPFLVGILAWFGPFAVTLTTVLLLGLAEIRATAPVFEIIAFLPLLVLLVFLLEALPEELGFRGYLQTNLGKLFDPWLAVVIQAVLFGSWGVAMWLIVVGSIEPMHASLFYAMGAILGIMRLMTGSIWTGIGFHLAFQTVAQLLLNVERGHFAIEGLFWVQVVALGMVPFSLAILIVQGFYRDRVCWVARPT